MDRQNKKNIRLLAWALVVTAASGGLFAVLTAKTGLPLTALSMLYLFIWV